MSESPTRSSLARWLEVRGARLAAALVLLATLGALVQGAVRRAEDPLRPALWIGLWKSAAAGGPAEVVFTRDFTAEDAYSHPVLEAEGDREWEVELDGRLVGRGVGPGPLRFELPGPIPAGPHRIVATVRHPTGVASIRLRLADASGKGSGVVTGRGWGADDDASGFRDRGRKGARYRAMVWGRPPMSSWSSSRVRSSLTRNGGSSMDAESSRIPSRAETQ